MVENRHELIDLEKLKESEMIPDDMVLYKIDEIGEKRGLMTVKSEFVNDVGKMVAYYLQSNPTVVSKIRNKDKKVKDGGKNEKKSSCLCKV